jgi:hypothetical protein
LSPVSLSFEWHQFADRSALFINSFRRCREIVTAKQNIESYLLLVFLKSTPMVLLRSSAPLSQLVFIMKEDCATRPGESLAM